MSSAIADPVTAGSPENKNGRTHPRRRRIGIHRARVRAEPRRARSRLTLSLLQFFASKQCPKLAARQGTYACPRCTPALAHHAHGLFSADGFSDALRRALPAVAA